MNGKRAALLIAASEYTDVELTRLRWPAADVTLLAEVLGNQNIGRFEVHEPIVNLPSHIVKRRIEAFLSDTTSTDEVRLLYFSCHGVLSDDRRLYFAMPDTDTKSLMSTAVDDYFVHTALQKSRAKAKVLILDCCHSGAFARGLPTKGSQEREVDVERLTGGGLVTLTASKEIEYAYEHGHFTELDGATGGSIFTQLLVEGLRTGGADLNDDGVISVDELYEWTADRMRTVTSRQQPGHSSFRRHGRVPIGWSRRSRLPQDVRAGLEDTASLHGRLWAIDRLRALSADASPDLAAEISEALTKAVGDPDVHVAASAEAALAGRPTPAIAQPTRDAPSPPSMRAASLVRRGDEHRAARRFKVALDKYEEALRVSPEATSARVGRARTLLGLGRLDDALETLDAAIDSDPTHAWARVSRAEIFLQLDRPAAALLDVEAALLSEKDSTEALTIQGRVRAMLGHTEKAIEAYELALEHDVDNVDALVGLAEALAEAGAVERALVTLDRAIEIDDAFVDARRMKVRVMARLMSLDQSKRASTALRALARDVDPGVAEAARRVLDESERRTAPPVETRTPEPGSRPRRSLRSAKPVQRPPIVNLADLPIRGYDTLTATEIHSRLQTLTVGELTRVRAYEASHAQRDEVLRAISRAIPKARITGHDLPIRSYGELDATTVLSRLLQLKSEDLELVRIYEERNLRRRPVLSAIERLLARMS